MLKHVDAGIDRYANRIGIVQVGMYLDTGLVRFFDDGAIVVFSESDPDFDDVDTVLDEFSCLPRRIAG